MFVVADQPPVQYQDPECLLHPPPFGLRNESLLLRVPLDDLDVYTEGGPCVMTWFLKPWSTRVLLTEPPAATAT